VLIVAACLAATITIACIARAPMPAVWMVASGILLGLPPSIMMSLLPRAVASEHLSAALGVYYGLFYLGMAISQALAGLLRDITGDPGMPLLFAAVLMAAAVPAVFAFWRLEGRGAPEPEEAVARHS
jgi:predicted MFS family arabinose efflux permease